MNSPKLRFPEFEGEWEKKKLGEIIIDLESGVSVNSIDEPIQNINEFGILKTSCISSGKFHPTQNKKIVENEILRARLNPKKNTILISRMNTPQLVGESGYIDKDYANLFVPDRLWMTKISDENSNVKFLSILLSSQSTMSAISNISSGTSGSMKNIAKPNFLKLEFSFPTLPEQTKIANFLTAVDVKLSQLKKKKSLLEEYKKGVMQKIFSQELRFKDESGKEYAEWEEKKLGEILIKNSKKNKSQKYSLVQSVSNKYGFINQDEMFEDRRVASKDTSNYYLIEKGCFAYNPSRIDVGSLAYKYDDKISVISPLYISFRANNNYITDEFLLNWFSTEQFLMQMNNSFEGSVRNTLSYESLIKMKMSISTLLEQTKIANFLSAIEDKINKSGVQIEKMEGWKKGLLQKMFV